MTKDEKIHFNGKIVAFEGIDGSGKTTQAERLCRRLQESGISASYYHTPYNSDLRKEIIKRLSEKDNDPAAIIRLFNEDIYRMLADASAAILVADRWTYSSIANWVGNGMNYHQVLDMICDIPKADLCFFMDVSPEQVLKRKLDPDDPQHSLKPQQIKYANYLKYMTGLDEIVRIDGSQPIGSITELVYQAALDKIKD
jgi:dTMP kinase